MTDKVEPTQYWKQPPGEDLGESAWLDPYPSERGLLSARRIRDYVAAIGMIDSFDPAQLRPAAHGLTLGPICQAGGKDIVLTDKDPVLEIPSNGLVFVSMQERVRLPHYIAARFNLSIEMVYRGVLLGTGPQVDPGFHGVLSCPIHNLSNETIPIKLGQHIATIDFVKTTGLATPPELAAVTVESNLYEANERLAREARLQLYPQDHRWRRPVLDYQEGTKVTGSVFDLDRRVVKIERFGFFAGAAAIVAIGLASFGIVAGVISPIQTNTKDVSDLRVTSAALSTTVDRQHAENARLAGCVDALRAQVAGSPVATPVPVACKSP